MSVKQLNQCLFDELANDARKSPRLRSHHNFHQTADDAVQRVLIALQPESYVAVHSHPQSWKWEMLLVLRGELDCLVFSAEGEVLDRYCLTPEHNATGVELPAGCWHSIICKQPDTILLEIKPGPYDPGTAAIMTTWCPLEGSEAADPYHKWMKNARIGERFTVQ